MAFQQRASLPAIMAILAALLAYVSSCSGHWILGLILALLAIPLGLVGLLMAASPRVTGGILSVVAMVMGVLGLILAALSAAGRLVAWGAGV